MNKFEGFTEKEKRMLVEAVWRRQRSFIAGDKQFKEYGKLLDELLNNLGDYVPGKVV